MCLGNLIEGDPLGDARPDGVSCQQPEEPLKVLAEPGGMLCPHHIDRVAAGALTTGQPVPQIQTRYPHQHGEHATLRLHARRIAVGAEQTAALERCQRAAIAVLADAVEDDVEPARQDTREVLALVVDRRGAELAYQRGVLAARSTPHLEAGHPPEREQRLTDGAGGALYEHALASLHPRRAV